jgi:hypothetical protein
MAELHVESYFKSFGDNSDDTKGRDSGGNVFIVHRLGLRLGLGTDGGLNEKGVVVAVAHPVALHRWEFHSVWINKIGEHDSLWDRYRLPAPRPPTAALVFHEGDK